MSYKADMEEGFEPKVHSLLADSAIQKLMRQDNQSPEEIKKMLHGVKQARSANGWSR